MSEPREELQNRICKELQKDGQLKKSYREGQEKHVLEKVENDI